MEKRETRGIGFLSILTIIFVVAKLLGLITWSWWLVFAPTIFSVFLTIIVIIVALIVAIWGE